MHRLNKVALAVALAFVLQANAAQASPFNLNTCILGCSGFNSSGGGSIQGTLDIVNGNDFLITLTNSLNSAATGDAPFVDWLGFLYHSPLAGATIQGFTVLSGAVTQPSFINLSGLYVGFGFNFQNSGSGAFQALNPDESIRILVATSGFVNPAKFAGAVAYVGGLGNYGTRSALIGGRIRVVPEPTTFTLMSVAGLVGALMLTRRRSS
jgi:hypothetical protein